MPFVHGKNAKLMFWDGTIASNVAGDLNSITLSWSHDTIETTTMGQTHKQRMHGIKDATIQFAGLHDNTAASNVARWCTCIASGSLNTCVIFWPAGCPSTGSFYYTGCFVLSAFESNAPGNGPVAVSGTLQLASGSLASGASA